MTYKIEVVKGKKQWYWRIMHRNGNILAHSETYSSREKAVRTAKNLHETFKRNTCGFSIAWINPADNDPATIRFKTKPVWQCVKPDPDPDKQLWQASFI